jgi:predicted enzyme related to lactoylglutathione lyase
MPNPLIFVDIPSPDPEASSQFYADLFGWEFNRRPAGEFHEILPGIKPNLGIHKEDTPMSGPIPRIYVMVEDPPACLQRAIDMGSTKLWDEVHWEEFDGRHAGFRDPWGNEVVLWRDKGSYKPGGPSRG